MNESPDLQGNHGFRVRQISWGAVVECGPLTEVAEHCFTTRDVDFRTGRPGSEAAWRGLAQHLGVALDRIYAPRQVHGAKVTEPPPDGRSRAGWIVPPEADVPEADVPEADVIVSDRVDAAVAIQTADCVAVLIADRRARAVAAVHAGWRGTASRAAGVAVEALAERFGSAPSDLIVAIGPSIGPCCYVVGDEVRETFAASGHSRRDVGRWFERGPAGRWHLDLWAATRDQLLSAGVAGDCIHVARACTATELTRFFSYRREGPSTGRLVAAIRPKAR